ncbi:MAG: CDP-archaeol synthase [Gammaproteobacteria bacterium]
MSEIIACSICFFKALLLLLVANGVPVVAEFLWGRRFAAPLDAGLKLGDGLPLLGAAKTWRGVIGSIFLTSLVARSLNLGLLTGVWFAILSMIGDISASFCKRRLGLKVSSRSRMLDTLPESLLPTIFLKDSLGLNWAAIIVLAAVFLLIEEYVSPLLYKLNIRKRPY